MTNTKYEKPQNDLEEIALLDGKLKLFQPVSGFRTSFDTIMLIAALPKGFKGKVLDIGCGVGAAGLGVLTQSPHAELTGVDIVPKYIEIAKRNADLNEAGQRCQFITSDIFNFAKGHEKPIFDFVLCNPPYYDEGTYIQSPEPSKDIALGHHESRTLEQWVQAVLFTLKPGGIFAMVHRADKLDKILALLDRRFGKVEIMPLWPKQGRAAKRVVIRAVKGRKSVCELLSGTVIHEHNGDYTPQVQAIIDGKKRLFGD